MKNISFKEQLINSVGEDKLLKNRKIVISQGITSDIAKKVISDLLVLDQEKNDDIFIFLNSPGGEVTSGFGIYDVIKFIKSNVKIINVGLCASIATIINISVKKEMRFSLKNTKFLIHQPLIMGRIYGQASDIEITAKDILKTRDLINQLLAKECSQKLKKVEKDTTRDYWMDSNEALEYGLIGKVIENISEII